MIKSAFGVSGMGTPEQNIENDKISLNIGENEQGEAVTYIIRDEDLLRLSSRICNYCEYPLTADEGLLGTLYSPNLPGAGSGDLDYYLPQALVEINSDELANKMFSDTITDWEKTPAQEKEDYLHSVEHRYAAFCEWDYKSSIDALAKYDGTLIIPLKEYTDQNGDWDYTFIDMDNPDKMVYPGSFFEISKAELDKAGISYTDENWVDIAKEEAEKSLEAIRCTQNVEVIAEKYIPETNDFEPDDSVYISTQNGFPYPDLNDVADDIPGYLCISREDLKESWDNLDDALAEYQARGFANNIDTHKKDLHSSLAD